MRDGLTDR